MLPIALALINNFRVLIDEAIEVGALTKVPASTIEDPIQDPDSSLNRRCAGPAA